MAARAEDAEELSLAKSVSDTLQINSRPDKQRTHKKPRDTDVTQEYSQYWIAHLALLSNPRHPKREIILSLPSLSDPFELQPEKTCNASRRVCCERACCSLIARYTSTILRGAAYTLKFFMPKRVFFLSLRQHCNADAIPPATTCVCPH